MMLKTIQIKWFNLDDMLQLYTYHLNFKLCCLYK